MAAKFDISLIPTKNLYVFLAFVGLLLMLAPITYVVRQFDTLNDKIQLANAQIAQSRTALALSARLADERADARREVLQEFQELVHRMRLGMALQPILQAVEEDLAKTPDSTTQPTGFEIAGEITLDSDEFRAMARFDRLVQKFNEKFESDILADQTRFQDAEDVQLLANDAAAKAQVAKDESAKFKMVFVSYFVIAIVGGTCCGFGLWGWSKRQRMEDQHLARRTAAKEPTSKIILHD